MLRGFESRPPAFSEMLRRRARASVAAVEADDVDVETFAAAQQVGISTAPESSKKRTRLVSRNEDPADAKLPRELN